VSGKIGATPEIIITAKRIILIAKASYINARKIMIQKSQNYF
jgi:hypothetical protein